jgi:peptidoglycan/LPS O-acetylase OafA/YrhL
VNLHRFEDRTWTRVLFWALALFALVMALIPHPPELPGDPSDKVQHMTAFAALSLVGSIAYSRITTIRLLIALSLFGALIEVAQAIPILHRDSDPLDWVADTVACVVMLLLVAWWRHRRR